MSGTPSWDRYVGKCRKQIEGIFGRNVNLFEAFQVFVEVKDKELCRLNEQQSGSMLWALIWMLDKNELSIASTVPGKVNEYFFKESDSNEILASFFEHGQDKREKMNDEACHPFIHNLLIACRCGGKLVVKRIPRNDEILEDLTKELNNVSGLRPAEIEQLGFSEVLNA